MKIYCFSKYMFAVILTMLFSFHIFGQSYVEICGNDTTSFSYHESLVDNELTIILSAIDRTEICVVDPKYYCKKWVYKDSKEIEFIAIRAADSIQISGKRKGKDFHYSIFIGNEPWLQFWEYGIRTMIMDHGTNMQFYSIDRNKPDKAALFLAISKGEESVMVDNSKANTVLVLITIKGLPAMIFTGKLWFRIKDNIFIKSEMPQGPFVSITKVEIRK